MNIETKTKTDFNLPQASLILKLEEKLRQRGDNFGLSYMGLLENLRNKVSQEVQYINRVFPEYTPHNDEYHFKNLFRIADTILGEELINEMNEVELFILSCGLYCHDWGMAVSEDEQYYIMSGEVPSSRVKDEFCIISNEHSDFHSYSRDKGTIIDPTILTKRNFSEWNEVIKDLNDVWSEYTRNSHAYRSGERVKKFFEEHNDGLGEAIKRVCIGHALDFNEIRSNDYYPTHYTILNRTVNLRALAIYVRLIDLLDLTEDRTPYVIWKFVSPKNSFSKTEWEKHRALNSVACPPYGQGGRQIKIDGHTKDPKVYAALEDLQQWCNDQFRGCIDMLSEMNHSYHKLNIYHINWNIIAEGFSPMSIRFDFNRQRMFEILGEQIYQNDMYVFLRELLQNSLDAIRMRKAKWEKIGAGNNDFGEINISIEKDVDGNLIINWRDNGIGMNDYIVKNYFSVAGSSYYTSNDFRKEGLNVDPISRFGIGFLSCATVADHVEIETYRDPYFDQNSKKLTITIPSFMSHFHIKESQGNIREVGTLVKIHINKKKFNEKRKMPTPDKIIDYLSLVGAFLEVPIIIESENVKTIILHPYKSIDQIENKYGTGVTVKQLKLDFDWEQAIKNQDIEYAKSYLSENKLMLDSDLGLIGYQGAIINLNPIDLDSNIMSRSNGFFYENNGKISNTIRKKERRHTLKETISPSYPNRRGCLVYIDGILVTNVTEPFRQVSSGFVAPQIVANIPKNGLEYDLSRRTLLNKDDKWFKPIIDSYTKKILNNIEEQTETSNNQEKFIKLAKTIHYYSLEIRNALNYIKWEQVILPFLNIDGKVFFEKLENIDSKTLMIAPKLLPREYYEDLGKSILSNDSYKGIFESWNGVSSIYLVTKLADIFTPILSKMEGIVNFILRNKYFVSAINFLTSPDESIPTLPAEVMEIKMDTNIDELLLIERVKDINHDLTPEQIAIFQSVFKKKLYNIINESIPGLASFPTFVNFSKPFDEKFGYGMLYFNSKNRLVRKLMSLLAHLICKQTFNASEKISLGKIEDIIGELWSFDLEISNYQKTQNWIIKFINELETISNITVYGEDEKHIKLEDFVPVTIELLDTEDIRPNIIKYRLTNVKEIKEFGQPFIG